MKVTRGRLVWSGPELPMEWVSRFLLIFLLGYLHLKMRPWWEFSGDDGVALSASAKSMAVDFWWGPRSSIGVPHFSFVYYIYSLVFRVSGDLFALQNVIIASHLVAYWLLIGIGKRVYSTAVAYWGAILVMCNANFLLRYDQRFWEPALLPCLIMLALFFLLSFLEKGKILRYFLSLALMLLASSAHLNVALLTPVILFIAMRSSHSRSWSRLTKAAAVAGSLLPGVPFFSYFGVWWIWLVGAMAIVAAGVWGWNFLARMPLRAIVIIGSLIAALAFFQLFFWNTIVNPARQLVSLLDVFTHNTNDFNAYYPSYFWWQYLPGLGMLFLFLGFGAAEFPDQNEEKRALFLFTLVPLLVLLVGGALMRWYPLHWHLVLFPLLGVQLAEGLRTACARIRGQGSRVFSGVFTLVVFLELFQSSGLAVHLAETGGVGDRLASFGTKVRVLERLLEDKKPFQAVLVFSPYTDQGLKFYDLEGWAFLKSHLGKNLESSEAATGSTYYLLQEGWHGTQEELRERVLAIPGVTSERIGSVTVYKTDRLVEGVGAKIP